jgi:beta-alanine--pyruvate transaminase
LDLLEQESAIQRVRDLAPHFEQAVHSLKGARHVSDIRNYGLAAGITIESMPGEPARRPFEVAMELWRKGFYVRFGGDTLQLAPPFIASRGEIDAVVNAIGEALAISA